MDVITKYLYMKDPLQSGLIQAKSFYNLKKNRWYRDSRGSNKFEILNKRFKIDDQWYRTTVRFKMVSDSVYKLDMPVPFLIAETYTEDGTLFIDQKVHHGRKVRHTLGYLDAGIPKELIDMVIQDLKNCVVFKKEGSDCLI